MSVDIRGLVKRFGVRTALDHATFSAHPGRVTVLLGPNGSGKTTALRILLGLTRATEGSATIGGRPYAELSSPLTTVGAVLGGSQGPRRTAWNHMTMLARAAGVPSERVTSVLASVDLDSAAHRPVATYSLGMTRRLSLAAALIADPAVLVLDEPQVGLDSDGLEWLADTVAHLAREGRTVLLSTHQLADAEAMATDLVVLRSGVVDLEGRMSDYRGRLATVIVESADPQAVRVALEAAGLTIARTTAEDVHVRCSDLSTARAALDQAQLSAHVRPGRTALQELVSSRVPTGGDVVTELP